MSEMAELLEKLKQLDEPTYKYYLEGMIARGSGFTAKMVMTQVQEAWLQFCIQRAIAAHVGWFAEIGFYEKRAYARISKILENREDEETEEMSLRDGTTPCIALLACYIACLESQP